MQTSVFVTRATYSLLMAALISVVLMLSTAETSAEMVQKPRPDTDRHLYVVPIHPGEAAGDQLSCVETAGGEPYNYWEVYPIDDMAINAAAAVEEASNGNARYTQIDVLPESEWPTLPDPISQFDVREVGYEQVHDNLVSFVRSNFTVPADANLMVVTELGAFYANGATGHADIGNGDMSLWTCKNYWAYEHQLGHSFGLNDIGSNVDDYSLDVAMGFTNNREYDYLYRDFAGVQKWLVGWIDPAEQYSHTVGAPDNPGKYTIQAIDFPDTAPQVLRIDDPDDPESLYIDYRVGEGISEEGLTNEELFSNITAANQKVFVRSMTSVYPRTEAMLAAGDSYVVNDSSGNFQYQINVGFTGEKDAQVSVTECEAARPTMSISSPAEPVPAGNFFDIGAKVFNNNPKGKNGCGNASFDFRIDTANLESAPVYDVNDWADVQSGKSASGPIALQLDSNATGTVQIPVTAYDVDTLLAVTVVVNVDVTEPDTTPPPAPTGLDGKVLTKGKSGSFNCNKSNCIELTWNNGDPDPESGTPTTVVEVTNGETGETTTGELKYGDTGTTVQPNSDGIWHIEVYHVNGQGLRSDGTSADFVTTN